MTAVDYRFARSPRWLVSHALVLALIAAMIAAGIWQLARHDSRRERNRTVDARSQVAPVPLAEVTDGDPTADIGDGEQYRRVIVTGEYRVQDEVLIRNRTLDGAPGWWVVTPLVTEDGSAVAVNRGWIPLAYDANEPRPGTEPPVGRVEIVGSVQPSRQAEGIQVADPSSGRLSSLARPDIGRLAQQLDYPLAPFLVQVEPRTGESEVLPTPLPLPALDGGPHLSYAVQWFVFTTIAVFGYPLVLRRVARGEAASA